MGCRRHTGTTAMRRPSGRLSPGCSQRTPRPTCLAAGAPSGEERHGSGRSGPCRRCRRSAPRRLRRRHMDSPRLRGADRLQRRVRAVVAPRSLGDEARPGSRCSPVSLRPTWLWPTAAAVSLRRWPRNGRKQGCRDARSMHSAKSEGIQRLVLGCRRASSSTVSPASCCTLRTCARRNGGRRGC